QSQRVHHSRMRQRGAEGHWLQERNQTRAASPGRPQTAPSRYHQGPPAPRLGTQNRPAHRPQALAPLLPASPRPGKDFGSDGVISAPSSQLQAASSKPKENQDRFVSEREFAWEGVGVSK